MNSNDAADALLSAGLRPITRDEGGGYGAEIPSGADRQGSFWFNFPPIRSIALHKSQPETTR
jgi:hypothetical protein